MNQFHGLQRHPTLQGAADFGVKLFRPGELLERGTKGCHSMLRAPDGF